MAGRHPLELSSSRATRRHGRRGVVTHNLHPARSAGHRWEQHAFASIEPMTDRLPLPVTGTEGAWIPTHRARAAIPNACRHECLGLEVPTRCHRLSLSVTGCQGPSNPPRPAASRQVALAVQMDWMNGVRMEKQPCGFQTSQTARLDSCGPATRARDPGMNSLTPIFPLTIRSPSTSWIRTASLQQWSHQWKHDTRDRPAEKINRWRASHDDHASTSISHCDAS